MVSAKEIKYTSSLLGQYVNSIVDNLALLYNTSIVKKDSVEINTLIKRSGGKLINPQDNSIDAMIHAIYLSNAKKRKGIVARKTLANDESHLLSIITSVNGDNKVSFHAYDQSIVINLEHSINHSVKKYSGLVNPSNEIIIIN